MPSPASKTGMAAAVGLVAALGSTLCCVGPLVAVTLGLSGAGLAATFEPLRPYLVVLTAIALGGGFALLRREESRACVPGTPCASPVARTRMRWMLWIAIVISIPLLAFPWWSKFVLG